MVRDKRATIKQCFRRSEEGQRGILLETQNPRLSKMHYEKALRNIEVMTYLKKGDYLDWSVIAAYYAMYQACLAILNRIGLHSRDHTCTIAIIEQYFVKTGKINKELFEQYKDLIDIVGKIEKVKINQKLINVLKQARDKREIFQYDVISTVSIVDVNSIMKNATEFVEETKILIDNLTTEFIEVIRKDLKKIKI